MDDLQWCCGVDGRELPCLDNSVYHCGLVYMDFADSKSGICRAGVGYSWADGVDFYRSGGYYGDRCKAFGL